MSFNLHNRSLLALKDFAPDEVRYLLDLWMPAARSWATRNR